MSSRTAVLIVFVFFAGTVNASNGLDQYLARVSGLQAVALIRSGDPDGVQRLMHAANRGDVIAQFNLGVAYSNGYVSGGEDAVRAARWYLRAAARGYARAAFNLGALYANGRLQDSDPPSEAKRWMKVAANAAITVPCNGSSGRVARVDDAQGLYSLPRYIKGRLTHPLG